MTSPTGFISYSWDNESHRQWVRDLATRMRSDGVAVTLDAWETALGDQLPEFMERSIRENEFVLIICTPRYKVRAEARTGGVGYEGDVITGEVLIDRNHRKFIPVLRQGTWRQAAPSWLSGKQYIDLSGDPYSEETYAQLVRTMLGISETAPPIGRAMSTIRPAVQEQSRERSDSPTPDDGEIRITGIVVESITQPKNDGTQGSALYAVPFSLSSRPSPEWSRLFVQNWNHPPRYTTMHRPGIASVRDTVVVLDGTTIEEVQKYHQSTLSLAVDETNRQYNELRERQRAIQAQEEASRREHRQRVEDIARQIDFDKP